MNKSLDREEIPEEWCLETTNGLHCWHFVMPDDGKSEPTKEVCCWCKKVRDIYFITSSGYIRHGPLINITSTVNFVMESDLK